MTTPTMTTPTPSPGYKPTFHMPVIGPPPSGTDPAGYYNTVTAATRVQVTQVANHGLRIGLSNPAYGGIFAMTGGEARFIPAGDPLPTAGGEQSPGAGSLVLQTWLVDVHELKKGLPPGVPPMTSVLYLNVKPDSVRSALDPLVRGLPEPVLQGGWDLPRSPANRKLMEDRYLERLLLGQTKVFVLGGTPLGEAEHADPANPSSDIELTLRFTDRAGNDLSPILHLRNMPSYGGAHWAGHPLVNALVGIPVPVNIYLQFEVWNETSKAFESLPAGIPIDLMEYDPVSPNDTLATQNTDSKGQVHFSFPNLQATAGEEPDIFFRARPNGRNHAGHTLPDEWSTKGWRSADRRPGYYENFTGAQLGDATSPLVFRVGLDFHIRLEYRHARTGKDAIAPKGVPISVHSALLPGGDKPKKVLPTDDKGEVHGVIFDIDAEDNVYFHIDFEIQDAAINLPRSRVHMSQAGWSTFWSDADQNTPDKNYFPDYDLTSIGEQSKPVRLRCSVNDRNVALYFLKILRELSVFLFHITDGAWKGVENLTMFRTALFGTAYSWPVGEVNIPPASHWDRQTIIHELSHQVMWKELDTTTLGIAWEARLFGWYSVFGDLWLVHRPDLLSNPEHALIEGWAEFMQAVFSRRGTPPYPFPTDASGRRVVDDTRSEQRLDPPPNNRGESVEGAFANGLWAIFQKYVVTPAISSDAHVNESVNGDVMATASWIQLSTVRHRFQSMIWRPLQELTFLPNPTSTAMLDNIRSRNTSQWHVLQAELQAFNMAMAVPTVTFISPGVGPASGGQRVTLTGTNFVLGTRVTIGGSQATNIVVASSTSLSFDTPPGTPGRADLVVATPAGSATVSYTYQ